MIETEFRWSMFSDKGNALVQDIFDRCLELATDLTDTEVWEYAYSRLELLSRNDATSEATNEAVCDLLWQALIEAYAIRNEDTVNYWFFDADRFNNPKAFEDIVNTYDVQYEMAEY